LRRSCCHGYRLCCRNICRRLWCRCYCNIYFKNKFLMKIPKKSKRQLFKIVQNCLRYNNAYLLLFFYNLLRELHKKMLIYSGAYNKVQCRYSYIGKCDSLLCTNSVKFLRIWKTGKLSMLHLTLNKQEFVRPRWPYDMRPSARAEKYIRDAGP